MPIRSNASRNGPIGLCQAESFRNSFADSVSFRFPSWQSLDGHPVPPVNYASGRATPASKSSAIKIQRRQAAYKPVALTLRHVQWAAPIAIARNLEPPLFPYLVDHFGFRSRFPNTIWKGMISRFSVAILSKRMVGDNAACACISRSCPAFCAKIV